MKRSLLTRAVELLGSQANLAEVLGITQPSVSLLLNHGKEIRAEYAMKIDAATNGVISKELLRPDLWPPVLRRHSAEAAE